MTHLLDMLYSSDLAGVLHYDMVELLQQDISIAHNESHQPRKCHRCHRISRSNYMWWLMISTTCYSNKKLWTISILDFFISYITGTYHA